MADKVHTFVTPLLVIETVQIVASDTQNLNDNFS